MLAKRQKIQLELAFGTDAKGERPSSEPRGTEANAAASRPETPAASGPLMEAVVEPDNLRKALTQVRRNKGAPGLDGMTVDDLAPYLRGHRPVADPSAEQPARQDRRGDYRDPRRRPTPLVRAAARPGRHRGGALHGGTSDATDGSAWRRQGQGDQDHDR